MTPRQDQLGISNVVAVYSLPHLPHLVPELSKNFDGTSLSTD